MMSFSLNKLQLIPKEPKQKLRVERFLLAQLSYLVCFFIIGCLYVWGMFRLDLAKTILFITSFVCTNLIFYIIFITGFNKRFSEPSLTIPQILVATIFVMLALYFTNSNRAILLIMYFIALIFGVFRLNRRQFLFLSLFALSGYALAILGLLRYHPEVIELKIEILQFMVLAVTLFWFTFMGGYISKMRSKLYSMNKNLEDAYRQIEELAMRDELTGLYNRRVILDCLKKEIKRAIRYKLPLSVSIGDVDYFKSINDVHGHLKGDEVLQSIANHLTMCIRDTDKIGRYGGEEFLIILPHTDIHKALSCLERCRAGIETGSFDGVKVTISFGVAQLSSKDTADSLILRADKALYAAKNKGRNRVCTELDL